MKDIIIIGAGPAGLTASIYGIRSGLDIMILERFSPGGQVVNTFEVENYPGFVEPVAGWQLMTNMEQQARRMGVEIASGTVNRIEKKEDTNTFVLHLTDGNTLETKSVIAATGASFKKLDIPGEKEFTGRGVSYCATCDGAFFKDKKVAVIGGGDTALEEAFFLTRFASKVYLIHRREQFRGSKVLQERVLSSDKITPLFNNVVTSINGEGQVESVTMEDSNKGTTETLDVDGVFIFIGYVANTDNLPKEILNEHNEIIVDLQMHTPVQGLFAAGDNRVGSCKQIVGATADGAIASMQAYEYLLDHELS